MVADAVVATAAAVLVTLSFPLYLKGAQIVLYAETVTWAVLTRHLRYILTGLVLNTGVVLLWMVPRLPDQLGGAAVLHAVLGVQAYAMLAFALTGIVRIFAIKRRHDRYRDPDSDGASQTPLSELHPEMDHWRKRLRVGVAGYVLFWLLAWLVGMGRYLTRYLL
jgi:hypothetical protein